MVERNNKVHMGAAHYAPEYSIKVADENVIEELVSVWKTTL